MNPPVTISAQPVAAYLNGESVPLWLPDSRNWYRSALFVACSGCCSSSLRVAILVVVDIRDSDQHCFDRGPETQREVTMIQESNPQMLAQFVVRKNYMMAERCWGK